MGWKRFSVFMFFLELALIGVLYFFDFSELSNPDTAKSIIFSLLFGVLIFLIFALFSGVFLPSEEEDREREKRINATLIIGFLIMVIAIIAFLNFYLFFKALLGNDLLVSLKVDNENFVIKNGDVKELNVKAKVLVNPFCEANCSLYLEDLSKEEMISSDNIYIKFSSPLSKDYFISSNEESSGQRLYKVSLECRTLKSRFCYVSADDSKFRTKIISVDYELNDAQTMRKEILSNITESMNRDFYESENILENLVFNYSSLDLSEEERESEVLNGLLEDIYPKMISMNELYLSQNYSQLGLEVFNIQQETKHVDNIARELNLSLVQKINSYNSLVENVSRMYEEISYLEDYNFTNSSILVAEEFVSDFNSFVSEMSEKNTIEYKKQLFDSVNSEKESLFSLLEDESSSDLLKENKLGKDIFQVNLSKISLKQRSFVSGFVLPDPSPVCCFRNECYKCINDPDVNYPVILVHGHSFNERLSAELSMESFSEMAKQMEKGGYIDAGYFYQSKYGDLSKGYLGKVNTSVVVEATYYLEINSTEEGSFIFDSKWESIDTYAERLNEIVSNVKYLTGKDKVIIVAHSMGGLVTRRYMQLYGEDSIERIILVGIPNHGIDGFVRDYCPVFGADIECSEMDKNSEFMKELGGAPVPSIPVYNIIGLGCFWEGSPGDGIIKNSSAYLGWATENIYVNGTCFGVDFFHVKMIKPEYYPDIYEIIKEKISG
jgi:hypothetical protein